ncbi:hypothetical protein C8Q76DRAFT_700879 [Earliella scabrosa]|nr:hypothetical protein C8Q76DRAFT_700879 [Earliella scabrosa]
MRSPVIAFSLFAAAAVSPILVSAAPPSHNLDKSLVHTTTEAADTRHQIRSPSVERIGNVAGKAANGQLPDGSDFAPPNSSQDNEKQSTPVDRTAAMRKAKQSKRASDQSTAGGNAYSGAASDSSGGDIQNDSTRGGLTNDDGSNNAGGAGSSFSGFAFGGNGGGHGPGGNAYSGATGNSRGGNVINNSEGGAGGSDVENTTANTAGGGGLSESGTAVGGPAAGPRVPAGVQRRAGDSGTAGGNAYSGATSDVSGGSVVNSADDRGNINNDGGSRSPDCLAHIRLLTQRPRRHRWWRRYNVLG